MLQLSGKLVLSLAAALLAVVAVGCQSAADKSAPLQASSVEPKAARECALAAEASEHYKAGRLDDARRTVAEALALNPTDVHLHILSSRIALDGGQLELAQQHLAIARRLAPDNVEACYFAGTVNQRLDRPELAFVLYQEAARRDPGELAYVLAEAQILVSMDRNLDALLLLQEKLALFPDAGELNDMLGQSLARESQYQKAIPYFRRAAALMHNNSAARERLAFALYATGDYRGAADCIAWLTAEPSHSRRADLLTLQGECQLHLDEPQLAEPIFAAATMLDPNSALAWEGLGQAALSNGDVASADIALSRAVALAPSSVPSKLMMGYVCLRQGHDSEALASFQAASELDPADTVSLCMCGYTLQRLGRADEAGRCYARALKIKPGNAMAEHLMASIDLNDQE